jgi:hypothetical protein
MSNADEAKLIERIEEARRRRKALEAADIAALRRFRASRARRPFADVVLEIVLFAALQQRRERRLVVDFRRVVALLLNEADPSSAADVLDLMADQEAEPGLMALKEASETEN